MQVGLSRRKAEYMIGIAEEITSGRLNIRELASLPGEDVQARLVAIRGIGAWTADNFRLFALADMDAWPVNDVALQEAMRRLKSLDQTSDRGGNAGSWRRMAPLSRRRRPCSLASIWNRGAKKFGRRHLSQPKRSPCPSTDARLPVCSASAASAASSSGVTSAGWSAATRPTSAPTRYQLNQFDGAATHRPAAMSGPPVSHRCQLSGGRTSGAR